MSDLLSVITFMGVTVALALPSLVALVIYMRQQQHSPTAFATMEETLTDMSTRLRYVEQERGQDHLKILALQSRMTYLENGMTILVNQIRRLGQEPDFMPDFMTEKVIIAAPIEPTAQALQGILTEQFNSEELDSLCFELGIPNEDIEGKTHSARARALVTFMKRRNSLGQLAAAIEKIRPNNKEL